MTDFEMDDVASREALVQRVALMEAMIAEGRRTTTRYGWMFLMWGVLYFAAMGWLMFLPMGQQLAWPVCITVGILASVLVNVRQKRNGGRDTQRSRSVSAVWIGMGVSATLYSLAGAVSGHGNSSAYVSGIMLMVGMAHGISALILRWVAQGSAAAVWWICGVAMAFATTGRQINELFLTAAFFGMVLFGVYAMLLERRRSGATVQQHA